MGRLNIDEGRLKRVILSLEHGQCKDCPVYKDCQNTEDDRDILEIFIDYLKEGSDD